MKKFTNKGFTLIELLVVIAIIGILASIVLVSLNSARNKGKDTRVISDVNQIRTQIEAEASAGGAYQVASGNCVTALNASAGGTVTLNSTSGSTCQQLTSDATSNSGSISVRTGSASPATSFTTYSVYSALASNAAQYYCVDSTGKAVTTGTAPTTQACP